MTGTWPRAGVDVRLFPRTSQAWAESEGSSGQAGGECRQARGPGNPGSPAAAPSRPHACPEKAARRRACAGTQAPARAVSGGAAGSAASACADDSWRLPCDQSGCPRRGLRRAACLQVPRPPRSQRALEVPEGWEARSTRGRQNQGPLRTAPPPPAPRASARVSWAAVTRAGPVTAVTAVTAVAGHVDLGHCPQADAAGCAGERAFLARAGRPQATVRSVASNAQTRTHVTSHVSHPFP